MVTNFANMSIYLISCVEPTKPMQVITNIMLERIRNDIHFICSNLFTNKSTLISESIDNLFEYKNEIINAFNNLSINIFRDMKITELLGSNYINESLSIVKESLIEIIIQIIMKLTIIHYDIVTLSLRLQYMIDIFFCSKCANDILKNIIIIKYDNKKNSDNCTCDHDIIFFKLDKTYTDFDWLKIKLFSIYEDMNIVHSFTEVKSICNFRDNITQYIAQQIPNYHTVLCYDTLNIINDIQSYITKINDNISNTNKNIYYVMMKSNDMYEKLNDVNKLHTVRSQCNLYDPKRSGNPTRIP